MHDHYDTWTFDQLFTECLRRGLFIQSNVTVGDLHNCEGKKNEKRTKKPEKKYASA